MGIFLRKVSPAQLKQNDGDHGTRKWIAHQGLVYDVTDCPRWRQGLHERLHFPGQDLTSELPDAPHKQEVFSRPCVRMIGVLSL